MDHESDDDRQASDSSSARALPPWRMWLSAVVVLALAGVLIFTLYAPGRPAAQAPPGAAAIVSLAPSSRLDVSTRTGSLVAAIPATTVLRDAPRGRPIGSVSTRTQFGTSRVVPVVRFVPGWLGVIAPELPNGRIGWITAARTALARVRYTVRVQLRSRRLTVFHDGRVARSLTVGVGRPSIPTPVGQFAVTDKLYFHPLSAAYGCCALALSAHEYHLPSSWTGQDVVAIHSTPETGSIGQSLSHGCIRTSVPEGRWLVANIPLGTIVTIRDD